MTDAVSARKSAKARAAEAQSAAAAARAEQQAEAGRSGYILPGLMLLFAVVGTAIAVYLTIQHYQGIAPVCPKADWFANLLAKFGVVVNCGTVTSSPYSVVGSTTVPITVPGLIWFVVSGALALWAILGGLRVVDAPSWLQRVHVLWAAAGLAFVIYLVYVEFQLLHAVCEWCSGVHVLTLLTFILALVRWQQQALRNYSRT